MKTNQGDRMVIPLRVTLSKKEIDTYANKPLREAVKVYKKQLVSRENHIKQLHSSIKDKKNIAMLSFVIDEVMLPMPKLLTKKRLIILSELYDNEYLTSTRLRELMTILKMNSKRTGSDFNYLLNNNLMQVHGKFNYYITDQGRQFVEYFNKNTTIMFFEMLEKRKVFRMPRAKNKAVVSDELRLLRSKNYKMMMQPFWDSSLKRLPRDKGRRCAILWEWMRLNKKEKDDFYLRMLHKWSSK